jgi:hypothetical protein
VEATTLVCRSEPMNVAEAFAAVAKAPLAPSRPAAAAAVAMTAADRLEGFMGQAPPV